MWGDVLMRTEIGSTLRAGAVMVGLLALTTQARAQSVISPERHLIAGDADSRVGAMVAIAGDELLLGRPGAAGRSQGTVTVHAHEDAALRDALSDPNRDAHGTAANFGASLAVDGDRLVIGAPNRGLLRSGGRIEPAGLGAAYVFDRSPTEWDSGTALAVPDRTPAVQRFGAAVAISGETLAVAAVPTASANRPGEVFVFASASDVAPQPLLPSTSSNDDAFGTALALREDTLVVGAPNAESGSSNSGAVFVFERSDGVWAERTILQPLPASPNGHFGSAVALSADGLVLAVGAPDEASAAGSVTVYRRASVDVEFTVASSVRLTAEDSASSLRFGAAVVIDAERMVVGADGRNGGRGGAYLLAYRDASWQSIARFVVARTPDVLRLGTTVAIEGSEVVVAGVPPSGVGAVALFVVPAGTGEMCSEDSRCESGVCDEPQNLCCERECGACETCGPGGLCAPANEGEACDASCGEGVCGSGVCRVDCDAGADQDAASMLDATTVRPAPVQVSGCRCRAGHADQRGVLVLAAVLGLVVSRRRRTRGSRDD